MINSLNFGVPFGFQLSSRCPTICPRSNYPIFIVTYYIKWITTSRTDGTTLSYQQKQNQEQRENSIDPCLLYYVYIYVCKLSSSRSLVPFEYYYFHLHEKLLLQRNQQLYQLSRGPIYTFPCLKALLQAPICREKRFNFILYSYISINILHYSKKKCLTNFQHFHATFV